MESKMKYNNNNDDSKKYIEQWQESNKLKRVSRLLVVTVFVVVVVIIIIASYWYYYYYYRIVERLYAEQNNKTKRVPLFTLRNAFFYKQFIFCHLSTTTTTADIYLLFY